jgi:hypothetical protein
MEMLNEVQCQYTRHTHSLYLSLTHTHTEATLHRLLVKQHLVNVSFRHAFKWLETEFRLVIGFIGLLQTVPTSNYNHFTNVLTLQFTIARAKSSQFVFTSCRLVTAPNSVDSSVSLFSGPCLHWLETVSYLTLLQMSSSQLLGYNCLTSIRVQITLWLAVFCQSVHFGDKPLETHNQNFYFSTELLRL